jgi:phosphotriesterase-related protein
MTAVKDQFKLTRREFLIAVEGFAGMAIMGCLIVPKSVELLSKNDRESIDHKGEPMSELITTLGPRREDELGLILPHEHVFVDLRTWDKPGYGQAEVADVIALMGPEIERARAAGVTAIVECSPVGAGRRADILKAVSQATGFPLIVPTGVYREPWIPPWVHAASEDELFEWMAGELEGEIEGSGVQAAWIKLSANDEGLTPTETKILRAAGRASVRTSAVIGSHTIRGRVVSDQLAVLASVGCSAERFIWIHASAEPETSLNLEMARQGAFVEFDFVGSDSTDAVIISRVQRMLDADLGSHILLSQDRGWYDPAQPGGGTPQPYTYLPEVFLPKLRQSGLTEATIRQLTVENPFRAFARRAG